MAAKPIVITRSFLAEALSLALILAVGALLRLWSLDYAQLRSDDLALWDIARDFAQSPRIIFHGLGSSVGVRNGPFQAYLIVPGVLASSDLPSSITASYAMVALLNVAGIVFFWGFVRSYWSPRLALLAALLYATNPWAVVFSRRLQGQDLVAPFVAPLVWSLCDLARHGRRRDNILPFLWLGIVTQVYVAALVHASVAAAGWVLGVRRIRPTAFAGGAILFLFLLGPYVLTSLLPDFGALSSLLVVTGHGAQIDLDSLRYAFHLVSAEGYQAHANHAGAILDATTGFPRVASLLMEVFLGIGLLVGIARTVQSIRQREAGQTAKYVLPLACVLLPAILLLRHSMPIYVYYPLVGFPMHFLFAALGVSCVFDLFKRLSSRGNRLRAWLPALATGAPTAFAVSIHLLLAGVFFTAIREYWPESDYQMPLRYTMELADLTEKLAAREGVTRVYIGGVAVQDLALSRLLRPKAPSLSMFDPAETFVRPGLQEGKALYILPAAGNRVADAFDRQLYASRVATLDVPPGKLRYALYAVTPGDVASVLSSPSSIPVDGVFDGRIRLDSYDGSVEIRPGGRDDLVLDWTILGDPSPGQPIYNAFLRLTSDPSQVRYGAEFQFYDPVYWRKGERITWWRTVPLPDGLESGLYRYLIGLYTSSVGSQYRVVPIVDPNGESSDGARLGAMVVRAEASSAPSYQLSVAFGQDAALEGYDIKAPVCAADEVLEVALYWKALAKMRRDYTVFVHLLGPDGKMLAQHDSQPSEGKDPTSLWSPQYSILDGHLVNLPPGLLPGQYSVAVGLYFLPTGERLGGSAFAATLPLSIEDCGR